MKKHIGPQRKSPLTTSPKPPHRVSPPPPQGNQTHLPAKLPAKKTRSPASIAKTDHHFGKRLEKDLRRHARELKNLKALIMTVKEALAAYTAEMDTFNAAQDAALATVSTSIEGITADVAELKKKLEAIDTSNGPISAEDQASLTSSRDKVSVMTAKLTAVAEALRLLDESTPPKVPTEPDPAL